MKILENPEIRQDEINAYNDNDAKEVSKLNQTQATFQSSPYLLNIKKQTASQDIHNKSRSSSNTKFQTFYEPTSFQTENYDQGVYDIKGRRRYDDKNCNYGSVGYDIVRGPKKLENQNSMPDNIETYLKKDSASFMKEI